MTEQVVSTTDSPDTELIAAVDLGSNSFHLVIARVVDGALQLLHREKQKVQLADGLDNDLFLSDEAMERGLTVLKQFATTLNGIPEQSVRVIATYTLRRARNSASFLRLANQVFPYPIEVIAGQEEARLIYQGVAHFEHYDGLRLVMDIGGGSTEFAIGQQLNPLKLSSRNMGCVSYAKAFFPRGKITAKRFERAILQAEQELEPIVSAYRKMGWQQAVGTSGTIKTIKDIISALGWHPVAMTLPHLLDLKNLLLQFDSYDDINLPGLTEDRKQLICPGLAILIAAFQMLDIQEMLYVDAALREGVLYEMSDRLQHHDIRSHTMASLVKRYAIDTEQSERVRNTALTIFSQVKDKWQLDEHWAEVLDWCATVYEVGLQINSSSIQRHSAYILNNTSLPGFNQEQQQLLATLVRFHRRKIKPEDFPSFYLYDPTEAIYALVMFRLAIIFNQKRRDDVIPPLQLTAKPYGLALQLPDDWCKQQPVLAADLLQEQQFLRKIAFVLESPQLQRFAQDELS